MKKLPNAVLLSLTDFDDTVEELDPEFQQSLQVAAHQHRIGETITLQDYLKERLSVRASD